MKNESKAYYLQVLGLSSNFNEIELKDAYRREAKKWHPDLNKDDIYAEERLQLINEAYDFLKSSQNRNSTKGKTPNNYSRNKKSTKENNSKEGFQNKNLWLDKKDKLFFYLGGIFAPYFPFLLSTFITFVGAIILLSIIQFSTVEEKTFEFLEENAHFLIYPLLPTFIYLIILGRIVVIKVSKNQIQRYKKMGGKLSEIRLNALAKTWWWLSFIPCLILSSLLTSSLILVFSAFLFPTPPVKLN